MTVAEIAVAAGALTGTVYMVVTGLAALLPPSWRITHAFARWAGDLRELRKIEVRVEDRPTPKDPST